MTWNRTGSLAVLALLALAPAGGADAQVIRGTVTEEGSGAPVTLAGVLLLSAARVVVSSALADSRGRYVLTVPKGGEYILRVQRLGYFGTESPMVSVNGDRSYDVDMTVRPEPIRIEGLEVEVQAQRRNSWAKERLRYMNPRWGDGNPAEGYGFRLITGMRLEAAKMRSKDALDLLRSPPAGR